MITNSLILSVFCFSSVIKSGEALQFLLNHTILDCRFRRELNKAEKLALYTLQPCIVMNKYLLSDVKIIRCIKGENGNIIFEKYSSNSWNRIDSFPLSEKDYSISYYILNDGNIIDNNYNIIITEIKETSYKNTSNNLSPKDILSTDILSDE